MSVIFRKAGFLTTLQDLGRFKFRRFGINPNGAMDAAAARLINVLIGNSENEAVLEMHFPAPVLEFSGNCVIAIGGADFLPNINGDRVENWRLISVKKNDVLKFNEKVFGNRAYLSVKGGFAVEKWLNSASTNLTAEIGGYDGRKFATNDILNFKIPLSKSEKVKRKSKISNSLISFYQRSPKIRIITGAEFEFLSTRGQKTLLSESYTISQNSNRMGFQLSGSKLESIGKKEITSSAVNFGTVQRLPGGEMIILMADHQTSGGYPRIANIISVDLPLVAQLGAGDKLSFQMISVKEAEDLFLKFERDLNLLKYAVEFNS